MDEIIKEWLTALYDKEIEATKVSIENERIWANGSDDETERFMHLENIERLEKYIEVLEDLKITDMNIPL
jgi:hypothetical protein